MDEKVKVYNFEVGDNHTYYVSEKGILVHNDCDIIWKGFSKGELNVHFLKHGAEFGEITQSQYLKLAKGFASETGEHIEQQTVGKFLIKYNKNTQDILVGRMDLREIRTFYMANPVMTKINPFQDALDFAATLTK
ncbi:hypothetical protein CLA01_43170 [Chryseobacterium lathyri]|uniref:Intein C-terminal splicing domain-containing protein n=1 Tax=Chryseobacterium lathyri TaxID=395933 RepID=A0A511YGC0_9FLAO|nr:hypothetical protein CLA01_43170 [Chryseobacterium lathyri]